MRETIAAALGRWVEPNLAACLARFLVVVLQGMSVQVRDGTTREELEKVIEEASKACRGRPQLLPLI